MMRQLLLFGLLYLVWLIFTGSNDPDNLLIGLVSCGIILLFITNTQLASKIPHHSIYRLFSYFWWLAREILVSSITVGKIIWSPKIELQPVIKWLPLQSKCNWQKVLYANSITLTPGTLCTELEENRIQIHALFNHDVRSLKDSKMEQLIDLL